MIQNQKHLIALVFAFFCFSCVNATQSVSTSSESTLSKSSSSSQSNGDLHGKFTLDSTKNTLNLANNQATFQDERSITYSLSGITSESGWFVLNKKGTFRNEASSFYFTAISVDFVVLSPFGSLLSKASNYAISSPANGAYPLVSGETLSFGSEEAFTYFSLFAPVGQFQINSITLSYDLGLSHEAKPLEQLDFYTVNDTHGASEEVVSSYHPGIEKLGQELRSSRTSQSDGSLVLSSGDMWQGSADSNMTKGLLMVDWMNGLGFESMAVGNHEFDWFPATIESNASASEFPVPWYQYPRPFGRPTFSWAKSSTTVERSGVKIGVIGAIGPVEDSIAKSSLGGCYFDEQLSNPHPARSGPPQGKRRLCPCGGFDSLWFPRYIPLPKCRCGFRRAYPSELRNDRFLWHSPRANLWQWVEHPACELYEKRWEVRF
jgi:hypothetical protein